MAAVPADPTDFVCRQCRQNFDRDDVIIQNKSLVEKAGRTPLYVCKDCNSIAYKLKSLKESDPSLVSGLNDLPADQKAKCYDDMRGLFMADVKKHLTETIINKETSATEESKADKPVAMAVSDARKLQMFVDNPSALENLLQDEESNFMCPKMKMHMVYVPQYSKSFVNLHTRETIHERALSGTRVIKAHPKTPGSGAKSGGEKGAKKLPAGLVQKVMTLIANSKNNLAMQGGHVLKAKTEEGKQFVTESMAERAQASGQAVADAISHLETFMTTATLENKKEVQTLYDGFNAKVDTMTDYSTKFIGALGEDRCSRRTTVS